MLTPAVLVILCSGPLGAEDGHRARSARPARGTYQPPTLPTARATGGANSLRSGTVDTDGSPLVVPHPIAESEWETGGDRRSAAPGHPASVVRPRNPVVQVVAIDPPPETISPPQNAARDIPAERDDRGDGSAGEVHPEEVHPEDLYPGDFYYGELPEHQGYWGEGHDGSCDGLPFANFGASCGFESGTFVEPACGWENCSGCDACSASGFIRLPQLCNDQWFGSAEWLLWYRRGQSYPVLAATSADEDPAELALFGGDRVGESSESGLRLSLGTWLDRAHCQSAAVRVWGLGQEKVDFAITGDAGLTVVRPFFNVTTLPGRADENIVVQPGTRDFLRAEFESDLYGGDASIRQLWVRGLGARVDFLYGYQYLRLDESLAIRSRTGGFPNAMLSVADSFDVENEFHGGQVGLAAHYDEGCWTFNGLAKIGFGNLARRATLAGMTTTQVGSDPAFTSNEGLLVRDTNAGSSSDSTFAVAPEVSLGLGYRMNRWMDVSVGYSFVMITDALQTWRTLDDSLAVNLEDPPVDPARPARTFSYGDYWAQGVQFGVNFNY